MPHNRKKREWSVHEKYESVVFGGEYSIAHALLAVADGLITGGTFTYEFLKDEVKEFGIDMAVWMAGNNINPLTETLYFDKFIFENWETPFPNVRVPLPNKFVPYCAARKRMPPQEDRQLAIVGGRFRAVNDRSQVLGYSAGFPNFHEANHGSGVVYGTVLIKPPYSEWRDIPAAALGNPADVGARFRAVNDWAVNNGFRCGFPNFHEANYGNGVVYGAILLKDNAVDWKDIPAAELGNPDPADVGARFRATNDWAVNHGYRAGFPNFHQADSGQGVVYGSFLIKAEAADWKDLPTTELNAV